jgi:hypothetical protein
MTDDLVALDFVELDPLPGQRQGREGLKEITAVIRMAFPDIHWGMEEMVAEGEMVFSRFTWSATHRGTFLGIARNRETGECQRHGARPHCGRQDEGKPPSYGRSQNVWNNWLGSRLRLVRARGELDGREAPLVEGVVELVCGLLPCGGLFAESGFAGEVEGLGGAADGECF